MIPVRQQPNTNPVIRRATGFPGRWERQGGHWKKETPNCPIGKERWIGGQGRKGLIFLGRWRRPITVFSRI